VYIIEIFKYMVNKRVNFLFVMLENSFQDIKMFLFALLIFIISFGVSGFLAFCSDVDDFRDIYFSIANMFRYLVSEPDYFFTYEK